MPEQLSQSQIDALLKKMSAGEMDVEDERQKIKEYDFKSPKKFTKEQLKALDGLHETFGRLLSSYLSGLLRTICEVEVLQIEEQRYYEYNNALPDAALIGIIDFRPEDKRYSEATLIMDMSTTLGFYLIDRLLGGSGKGYNLTRNYSEIEIAILTNVFQKVTKRLEDAWRNSLELTAELNGIETNSRLLQVFAPEDIVVIVIMSVRIGKLTSNLSICIPAENLEEFIDVFNIKFNRALKRQDPAKEQEKKRIVMQSLCESDLEIKAVFDEFTMELRDILQLQPEDVIPLNKNVNSDVLLTVDSIPWFTAKLGETKKNKAVRLNHLIES